MINSEAVLSFLFSSRDLSFPRKKKKGETKLDPTGLCSYNFLLSLSSHHFTSPCSPFFYFNPAKASSFGEAEKRKKGKEVKGRA